MKAEILRMLREGDNYISGQQICEKFGVSRTAVWKVINHLKEKGYEIEAVPKKGYLLQRVPDLVDEVELQSLRNTVWAGKEVHYFDSVDSTNIRAKEFAEKGCPEGTLVVAETQEMGKGRRGRGWESPAGKGIFMSMVIRPEINPNSASMLTLVAALSVASAIRDVTGAEAKIKWPNDIVLSGKKVCGILTEMSAQIDYINHIVIGIGVNVHNMAFPEEIAHMATSLALACGHHIHRAILIEKILEYFEEYYEIFLESQDLSGLQQKYNGMLANLYRDVRVMDPKEPFSGKAMGITKKGELVVDTWESRRLVSSGEVSVRGIYGYV